MHGPGSGADETERVVVDAHRRAQRGGVHDWRESEARDTHRSAAITTSDSIGESENAFRRFWESELWTKLVHGRSERSSAMNQLRRNGVSLVPIDLVKDETCSVHDDMIYKQVSGKKDSQGTVFSSVDCNSSEKET